MFPLVQICGRRLAADVLETWCEPSIKSCLKWRSPLTRTVRLQPWHLRNVSCLLTLLGFFFFFHYICRNLHIFDILHFSCFRNQVTYLPFACVSISFCLLVTTITSKAFFLQVTRYFSPFFPFCKHVFSNHLYKIRWISPSFKFYSPLFEVLWVLALCFTVLMTWGLGCVNYSMI